MVLYCLPFAGGNANFYRRLSPYILNEIEIIPIEYSGHGSRFREPLATSMEQLVEDVYTVITRKRKLESYALFGYSLGCSIAWKIVESLSYKSILQPDHLFLASSIPPTHGVNTWNARDLLDEQLLEKLVYLGGIPDEILREKKLINLFLPIIRNDIEVEEQWRRECSKLKYIDIDLSILYGRKDQGFEYVEGWKQNTSGKCEFFIFDEGHFFINQNLKNVASIINKVMLDKNI